MVFDVKMWGRELGDNEYAQPDLLISTSHRGTWPP